MNQTNRSSEVPAPRGGFVASVASVSRRPLTLPEAKVRAKLAHLRACSPCRAVATHGYEMACRILRALDRALWAIVRRHRALEEQHALELLAKSWRGGAK